MADKSQLEFSSPHAPTQTAKEAFIIVLPQIKQAVLRSRRDYAVHEPRMWSAVQHLSDDELVSFDVDDDLVEVRSAPTSYGVIVLGKFRLRGVEDGYIHVRIHDPPNRGQEDVIFHSIFTDEGNRNEDGKAEHYRAVQPESVPLEFFNE